ncbi:MAG: hypothetical protein ACLUG3_07215 [Bacilli bacterium]|jgi:hypothetical protein
MKTKNIYCLMILIAITMFSIAFWGNNKKNRKDFSIVFEESSINNYLQTYLESEFCAVAISNYEENSIQGEIYDMSLGGNLFVTKALFNYNVESNKLDIYEYNEKNRILKYYISDNKIYASVIKDIDIEDNLFNWELVSYDLNFKNKKILNSGVIVSPFDVPNFYYDDNNNNIFVSTLTDSIVDDIRSQEFSLFYLNNNSIEKLVSYNGIYSSKTGELSCGQFDIHINNDNLIYCITDYVNYQTIYSFNTLTKNIKEIYTNDIKSNWIISSYRNNQDLLFIGKYNVLNDDKAKIGYLNLKEKTYEEIDSTMYYGRNNFIANSMLFHKSEKWEFYNFDNNTLSAAKIINYKNKYFFPAYVNINNNTIMAMDDNYNLFLGKIDYNKT